MYDLKLLNKDIVVTSTGDIAVSDEKTEIARQYLSVRLKTLKGEWFLDKDQGIDWFNILSKVDNKSLVDTVIQRTITETQYISRIVSYISVQERGNYKYKVTFSAQVENGDIINFQGLEVG